MVDYSKWDTLDVSDEEAAPKPRVHRFDAPQSVTIGGGCGARGAAALEEEQDDDDSSNEPVELTDEDMASMRPDGDYREDVLQCRALAERALKRGDAVEAVRLLEKALRLGGAQCPGLESLLHSAREMVASSRHGSIVTVDAQREAGSEEQLPSGVSSPGPQSTTGGSVGDRYCWSQTRESVEINIFVPDEVKAKDVSVEVSDVEVCLQVRGSVLWKGEWEFKVTPEEDIDWEVKHLNGRRVVRLSVKKAPLPGHMSIVVWWPRVLKGEPAIDVDKIPGRKLQASGAFAEAWKDAHALFRERVKHRQPIPLELGSDTLQDHSGGAHDGGDPGM